MTGRAETRGSALLPKCKKAHPILETDGKYYCFGIIDTMYDEPIAVCRECKAYVGNIDEVE